MPRRGMLGSTLLDELHAEGCDGTEHHDVEVVGWGMYLLVVYTARCDGCGAADAEVVMDWERTPDRDPDPLGP